MGNKENNERLREREREREGEREREQVLPYLTMISGSQQEVRVSRDLMDNKENNERKPLDMTKKKNKGKD